MKKVYLIFSCALLGISGKAQMVIQSGSTVFLESGAKLVIQGDLTSSSSIQGTGTVVMKGSSLQNLSMNGNTIPNLEIDNSANVTLSGSNARIGTNLLFTNGKLLTASQDLVLAPAATMTGYNSARFIWTNGIGLVRKELTADISDYEVPVGENTNYRPVYITTSGGTYAAGANIGVRNVAGASPNRPPSIASLIASHWPVAKTAISGGTQTIKGQYLDPTDVTGTEANLRGYFFNGTDWTSVSGTNNTSTNQVSAQLTAASGELTAMNKFLAVGTRAFLHGAYNSSTGLMSDGLRSGTNVIPTNDPYRASPYSSAFAHVANSINETAAPSVFLDQSGITSANDNIVDWVFLELRNTVSPGNVVLQTRSALIQRDGDIVDVDGGSPVTFNNVVDGNYTIAVRHRNHLGLASNPSSPRTFTEAKSLSFGANVADLRSTGTALYGTSGTNYTTASHPTLTTVNLLWAGNVNANSVSNYSGPGNDRAALLTDLGGNQILSLSGYHRGDLNLNKIANYSGPGNDRAFLLSNVLGSNQITTRSQALPN